MIIAKLNIKRFFLILLTIFIYPVNILLANEQILRVYYSGFSFSSTYDSNKTYIKYTADLIEKKNSDTGIDIISSELLRTIKKIKFDKIDLDTDNLLDFDKYPDEAIVMSIALQHEDFTQEFNYNTKIYSGFYDAYFEIFFYDFSDKSLIASIPFDFEIQMLSETKLDKAKILKRIEEFYLKDNPFINLDEKINKFEIKRKYDRRIGVTKVNIAEKAFLEMPKDSKKFRNSYKNLIAQTFSKRLSKHHNIAIVPYMEGQAIGKSMKLRFIQSDKIYSIKLPNPDYHIHLDLKGFKKVLAKSSDVEDLFLYGSFVNFKIYQPDLDKIYFDNMLRGVTKIKIPKGQIDINEWRKYYYNMEILFDNFSKNISKPNKKWLKNSTKDKIVKDLKKIKVVLQKVK